MPPSAVACKNARRVTLTGLSMIDSDLTDTIQLTAPECNRQPGF
jgi:hypothetical protein